MNFTDFTNPYEYPGPGCTDINDFLEDFIKSTTIPKNFSEEMAKLSNYRLKMGTRSSIPALSMAAFRGNVDLIDHIVKIGGKALLTVGDCMEEGSPLHWACSCSNFETGYLAAKKLIQLGAPINIAQKFEQKDSKGNIQIEVYETPLEIALGKIGRTKIATLLLRLGGIARAEYLKNPRAQRNLEAAKKKIMTENEKLFKMGMSLELPEDILNYILSISAKLV
jgi:ankyrin repeat protein